MQKKQTFGPFKASIHIQGANQRGVFFPKRMHGDLEELLTKHKHAITIIVEDVSTLDES